MTHSPKSLFEKVWDRHVVVPETDERPATIYIDLHLIHEVTSPQAFDVLAGRRMEVRRPDRTLATIDHSTPTQKNASGEWVWGSEQAKTQVARLLANTKKHGITTHGWDSPHRGIVHVMGPEVGATQPGMTIVCGDSHTATHGAFGSLAFGIGTTQVGHVLATQCLLMRKPKSLCVWVDGEVSPAVTPKDIILASIAELGVGGGTGHVIEYRGQCFEDMSMEGRMTVCNMSIEAGARAGMIAPDATTVDYLRGRDMVPEDFERATEDWLSLASDEDCQYDKEIRLDAASIKPMVTYGTNPGQAISIDANIPDEDGGADEKSLAYMEMTPGRPIEGTRVDVVFVGSCTNSRLEDLRAAAELFRLGPVAEHVRAIIVPGSEQVKEQAEAEGLDKVFIEAGAQWREPGCSMCIGMNGDIARPGELVVSTSNRNFEGRQGVGVRTVLASPATAAASALTGIITDPRSLGAGRKKEGAPS